jgi:sigma-54 specific flagellar transcriptional regulator A
MNPDHAPGPKSGPFANNPPQPTEQLLLVKYAEVVTEIRAIFQFFDYELKEQDGILAVFAKGVSMDFSNPSAYIVIDQFSRELPRLLRDAGIGEAANAHRPLVFLAVPQDQSTRYPPLPWFDGTLEYPLHHDNIRGLLTRIESSPVSRGGGKSLLNRIIGDSAPMSRIKKLMSQAAISEANVLLLGESGCGKEVIAKTIHDMSPRHEKPFVAINCGAIPSELLESELFGHEKGAFTGAIATRKGRFELANGGTLFLDEIGDMPMLMQVKLLRVLQERSFERVGGAQTIYTNVRLIAATHQNLEDKIAQGAFRMDLFYRLHVFPIEVAPLRERREDIPLLVAAFAKRMKAQYGTQVVLEEDAMSTLMGHEFPGNVRELENLVERLAILYPGETISSRHLPAKYQQDCGDLRQIGLPTAAADSTKSREATSGLEIALVEGLDLKVFLSNVEKSLIQQALVKNHFVVAKAAKTLSLQRTTLVEKIKKLDIVMSSNAR